MTRLGALVLCVLVATSAPAATFEWGNGFDAGTSTKQATVGTYSGGVAATLPPVFRAQGETLASPDPNLYPTVTVSMPSLGNLGVIDLDSSSTAGASYGVSTFSADGHRTANTYLVPILGTPPTCFGGGALNGKICSTATEQNAGCGTTGVCRDNRIPLVTHATSGATGCTIFLGQACGNVESVGRTCINPRPVLQGLYGGPYTTPGAGVCGSSKTMDDTPCGGPCDDASDCLQGRPDAVAGDPTKSEPTACVKDTDGVTACDGTKRCAAGSNVGVTCTVDSQCPSSTCQFACYCKHECDEVRKSEATCAPKFFMNVPVTRGEAYALAAEHYNQTDPGVAQCRNYGGIFGKLCAGGANDGARCTASSECPSGSCVGSTAGVADDVSIAFTRGGGTQKVGICTGGSTLANGGRKGTACAQTARNGTDPGCQCGCYGGANAGAACTVNSECPGGTCPGGCSAGTCTTNGACAGGSNAGATCTVASQCPGGLCQARITPDRVQWGWNDGTNPKARVLLDASMTQTGDSPVTNWRAEVVKVGGESGVTTGWDSTGCSGTDYLCLSAAGEPDGVTTFVYNQTALNTTHEWTFANPLSTSLTPLGVAMNVAMNDAVGSAGNAAGLQLQVWDAGNTTGVPASPTAFDVATFDFDDGTSGGYYPVPPVIVTNGLGTLTSSEIDGWRGRIVKADIGNGLTSREIRVTFADLEVFWQSPSPDPPNVLPGDKVGGVFGDSTSNNDSLYQTLAGLVVEPLALYDGAAGGSGMGDMIAAVPSLFAGTGTSRIPLRTIFGTPGQNVDFGVMLITANTFNGLGTGDPANPVAFDGLLQAGHCESWSSGSGYTASQGKPCHCDEVSNWTSPNGNFVVRCLMKNASFGLTSDEGYCLCGAGSDCSLGGASPSGASATTTTCTGGFCANTNASQKITAAAGTRSFGAPGCITPSCPNGVCVQTNNVARVLRGKRELDALAAAAGTHLIWSTQPIPNGEGFENSRPAVEAWNAVLMTEQQTIGGDWLDWAQYFLDQCGPSILTKFATNPCTIGVHYTTMGTELYAKLINACWSNTTFAGVENSPTDGACTAASGGTCSSGKCTSGLRKGIACGSDADCNYCSGGAIGKLGRKCADADDCGYYRCAF